MKTILALLMMVLSTAAFGQLVKCTAKDGRVVYAANCPPDMTETQTGIRGSTAGPGGSTAAPPQKSLAERDAAFKKRQIEQQEAEQKDAKKLAETQQRKDNCENARSYVRAIEEGQRITKTDPKTGERVYLEDAERASELAKARTRVSDSCK